MKEDLPIKKLNELSTEALISYSLALSFEQARISQILKQRGISK